MLAVASMPQSEALELTERFAVKDPGKRLEERITFDDPNTFSKPWDTRVSYAKVPDGRIAEDICLERLNITLKAPDGVR